MKKLILYFGIGATLTSCVTANKYNDLQAKKIRLESEKAECAEQLTAKTTELETLQKDYKKLEGDFKSLTDEFDQVNRVLTRTKTEYNNLEDLHDRLTAKYNELLKLSNVRTNQLTTDLSSKEQELFLMEKRLNDEKTANDQLSANLKDREARVVELEKVLEDQQKSVEALRSKVSNALLGFTASELSVERRDGMVYVSLAEQLLFKSGSTKVDPKGQDALQKLAKVLSTQTDLNIIVEGHTDDVPISKPMGYMTDNWDLSVLRATEIVRLLTTNGVNPTQVQAAGRGEFKPKNPEKSTLARKENRRTEIILSPKLDDLFKMIDSK